MSQWTPCLEVSLILRKIWLHWDHSKGPWQSLSRMYLLLDRGKRLRVLTRKTVLLKVPLPYILDSLFVLRKRLCGIDEERFLSLFLLLQSNEWFGGRLAGTYKIWKYRAKTELFLHQETCSACGLYTPGTRPHAQVLCRYCKRLRNIRLIKNNERVCFSTYRSVAHIMRALQSNNTLKGRTNQALVDCNSARKRRGLYKLLQDLGYDCLLSSHRSNLE